MRRRSHVVPVVFWSKRGGTYHTEDMRLRLPFEELDIARPTDREGAKLFDEAEDASEIAMEAQAIFYEAAQTLDEKTMEYQTAIAKLQEWIASQDAREASNQALALPRDPPTNKTQVLIFRTGNWGRLTTEWCHMEVPQAEMR